MRITVVHALAEQQVLVELDLEPGASAQAAVAASGLVGKAAPAVQLGIAGRKVQPDRLLQDGDRIEILRPLAASPDDARRRRAKARKRA